MAVRSTQGQNRAVRSTPGGRGVSPSYMYYGKILHTKSITHDTVDQFYVFAVADPGFDLGGVDMFKPCLSQKLV